uniref:Peptidase A2 domain-containing protein n=1 Tax=Globodera pallida TaxID=36090 RepID=A0A183CLF3_GLOPA
AMSNDGHFWIQAKINGEPYRFLVDTGATLTALSESTAAGAQVPTQQLRQSVMMKTANGTIRAELARIDELRFGNVVARDLDAVIAPGLGETNVIGMNLLSRLASWRVEGRTLVLVPNHPQAVLELERDRVREPAVAVALQGDALPLGQDRQLLEAEDHQLAVVADDRDVGYGDDDPTRTGTVLRSARPGPGLRP